MHVAGQVITEEQQVAIVAAMNKPFRASELEAVAEAAGVPFDASMRAVDRLIQKARKAGHIERAGAGWVPAKKVGLALVKEPDAVLGIRGMPLENCAFCRTPTPFWFQPKDVAVCEDCGTRHTPDQVPNKKDWIAAERAISQAAGR